MVKGYVGSDVFCPYCKDVTLVRSMPVEGVPMELRCFECRAQFECPTVELVQTQPPIAKTAKLNA